MAISTHRHCCSTGFTGMCWPIACSSASCGKSPSRLGLTLLSGIAASEALFSVKRLLFVGWLAASSHSMSVGISWLMSVYVLRWGCVARLVMVQGSSTGPFNSSKACSLVEAARSCSGAAFSNLPPRWSHTQLPGRSCPDSSCRVSTARTLAGPTNWPVHENPLSPPPGTCCLQKKN